MQPRQNMAEEIGTLSLTIRMSANEIIEDDDGCPMSERESAEHAVAVMSDCHHPLVVTLASVVEQAVSGKGEDRHGHGRDYLDQPWVELARDHGPGFLTGQAGKKLTECVQNWTRWTQEQRKNELIGAIAYLGMTITFEDLRAAVVSGQLEDPYLAVRLGVTPEEITEFALLADAYGAIGRGQGVASTVEPCHDHGCGD